jgi:hypothetical protein
MGIWHALRSERLKLSHSLALRLAFIAPLLVALIHFASFFQRDAAMWAAIENPWDTYLLNLIVIWCLLMQPLFITLQTALLGGLEHNTQGWKHLFALPVARSAVYGAKQILALGVAALSALVLTAVAAPSGLIMGALHPASRLTLDTLPWRLLGKLSLYCFLASWAIIAFHAWVGMRSPSFVLACSVGIGATVASILIASSDYGPWCPWSFAGVVGEALATGDAALMGRTLLLGVGGGLLATLLGGWEFCRHEVA